MKFTWGHQRRFNAYAQYFKREFGERVQKLAIDAGFTCPNRDGSKGTGGCSFCNNDAFNPSYCTPVKSVSQQIAEGIEFHHVRYRKAGKYLAYFQAYSNTYAPLEILKEKYHEALLFPSVIGLVIGTRPDCIDDSVLEYLQQLSLSCYIMIEYGIESCDNQSLKRIRRGHTYEDSVNAILKTKQYGIKTGAHLIFGLPGESREHMLSEAGIISALPLDNIKFHQLQILRDTAMATDYEQNPSDFLVFTLDEYIEFIIDFLEHLNPGFIVERFAGEVPPRFLSGPGWGLIRNDQILVKIEKRMEERDTWQGRLFNVG